MPEILPYTVPRNVKQITGVGNVHTMNKEMCTFCEISWPRKFRISSSELFSYLAFKPNSNISTTHSLAIYIPSSVYKIDSQGV